MSTSKKEPRSACNLGVLLIPMNRVDVIRDIESAFMSVTLEDGIGILEGEAIHNGVVRWVKYMVILLSSVTSKP